MRLVITKKDWVKAVKATRPTLRQQLTKEAFEAVDRPLIDGDIDRDAFGHLFDTPDEADLASVQVEDDGSVWLRVSFFYSVDGDKLGAKRTSACELLPLTVVMVLPR